MPLMRNSTVWFSSPQVALVGANEYSLKRLAQLMVGAYKAVKAGAWASCPAINWRASVEGIRTIGQPVQTMVEVAAAGALLKAHKLDLLLGNQAADIREFHRSSIQRAEGSKHMVETTTLSVGRPALDSVKRWKESPFWEREVS
jgi:hypothetical protein